MILHLLLDPKPLGAPAPLPTAIAIRIAAPETWTLQQIPAPRQPDTETFGSEVPITVTVGGKKVTIRPTDRFEHIDGIDRGSDGSLLIHRGHRGIRWDGMATIWYRGKEQDVKEGGVSVYRDRLNYAGSFIRETNAIGFPESAPEAFQVSGGKYRDLGWGAIDHLGADGVVVLRVPVDESMKPSGAEFTVGSVTRIVHGGKEWLVPGYGFLGRQKDGTIVLASSVDSVDAGNGYVALNSRPGSARGVLLWRNDAFVAHYKVPSRLAHRHLRRRWLAPLPREHSSPEAGSGRQQESGGSDGHDVGRGRSFD